MYNVSRTIFTIILGTNLKSLSVRDIIYYAVSHPRLQRRLCITNDFICLLNYLGKTDVVDDQVIRDAFSWVNPGVFLYEDDLGVPKKSDLQLEIIKRRTRKRYG